MSWRTFKREWFARRSGRRFLKNDLGRSAREVVGPTGSMFSGGWDAMVEGSAAYVESFDRRIPPSEFVSHRDRTRWNMPVPLVERCIEDWHTNDETTFRIDTDDISHDSTPKP